MAQRLSAGSVKAPILARFDSGLDSAALMAGIEQCNQPGLPQVDFLIKWNPRATDVCALYADHGTHEQFHSEFKTDLDLTRLPLGKFDTRYLVCQRVAVAMNILRLIGQRGLLGPDAPLRHPAKRRRLKTVMQELIYLIIGTITLPITLPWPVGNKCTTKPEAAHSVTISAAADDESMNHRPGWVGISALSITPSTVQTLPIFWMLPSAFSSIMVRPPAMLPLVGWLSARSLVLWRLITSW